MWNCIPYTNICCSVMSNFPQRRQGPYFNVFTNSSCLGLIALENAMPLDDSPSTVSFDGQIWLAPGHILTGIFWYYDFLNILFPDIGQYFVWIHVSKMFTTLIHRGLHYTGRKIWCACTDMTSKAHGRAWHRKRMPSKGRAERRWHCKQRWFLWHSPTA